MKVKVKALIDGVEKEIEVDLAANNLLTVDAHEARVKDQVKKRLKRHAAELATDEEFVKGILQAKGIDPANPKGGAAAGDKDVAAAIEKAQGEWRVRELEPLKKQLDEASGELSATRESQLISALESSFLTGADGLRVKKGVARKLAEIEAKSGKFAWDPEHKYWALKDGEDFAYAAQVTKDRPYAGVDEFAATFVKNKDYSDFVERTSQSGPGLGKDGGPGGGSAIGGIRSRADFKSETDKVKWIGENGFQAFTQLPEK